MRARGFLSLALLATSATPLLAQEMIQGVYARSQEQCAAAKADFQAYIETGDMVMTARGIEGIEYNCEFLDWKKASRSPGAVVTALCEEPGIAFPEVYALMPRGEGEIELTSPLTSNVGEMPGHAGMYYLCEGVSPP